MIRLTSGRSSVVYTFVGGPSSSRLSRQPRRVDERLRVSRTVRVAERHDEDHASEQPVEKAPLHSTGAPRQARDALSPRRGGYAGLDISGGDEKIDPNVTSGP